MNLLPPPRPAARSLPERMAACRAFAIAQWHQPRGAALAFILALALVPVGYILQRAAGVWRDIVYWDEIDTALGMLLRLDAGATAADYFRELFAINNEHRMVTSRLIFAASYWLTGTVNFTAMSVIGAATIVLLFAALVASAGGTARRAHLAVLLAALLFQLEHYENFFWSGASIDHFQVVLLVALAVIGAARGSRAELAAGAGCALAATFTLMHGLLAWPAGAWTLWQQGRRRAFTVWCAGGALAGAAFLAGFRVNAAQEFAEFSVEGALEVGTYWLSLLGAVPALDVDALEPWLGVVLLGLIALAVRGGAIRREPIALPLVGFAVGAMGLVAVGRAEGSGGEVFSRYYVLGALAWALTLAMLLARYSPPRAPLRLLVAAVPLLAAFNLAANRVFAAKADSWVECRDRAATRYKQFGADGGGPFTLHPAPAHATAVLAAAEHAGIYRMPSVCRRRAFPAAARETSGLHYFVEQLAVDRQALFVEGWVAAPGRVSDRGQIHLVLRSATETHLFTTITIQRPDVAKAHAPEAWDKSGFRFVRRRVRLPEGDYQVGFLLMQDGKAEFMMTAHRVNLTGEGKAMLATGG
jgi:hypothetical protein